jgi:hypothetical protein
MPPEIPDRYHNNPGMGGEVVPSTIDVVGFWRTTTVAVEIDW